MAGTALAREEKGDESIAALNGFLASPELLALAGVDGGVDRGVDVLDAGAAADPVPSSDNDAAMSVSIADVPDDFPRDDRASSTPSRRKSDDPAPDALIGCDSAQ